MTVADQGLPPGPVPRADFATTRWSMVLAAGSGEAAGSREALTSLCEIYWYPLYTFVRRKGYGYHEAQELTQEFFSRLLEKKYLKVVSPERGRFRSFLLVSLKHFLSNEWDRARAQKRGGGRAIISLDLESAEGRYHIEPSHRMTADMLYEREWALTLLHAVLGRLQRDMAAAGKSDLFEHCRGFLSGEGVRASYAQIAGELDMTEGAVKVAVHRMRRRFREVLREEISQTVQHPEEIDDEIRHLISVITARGT